MIPSFTPSIASLLAAAGQLSLPELTERQLFPINTNRRNRRKRAKARAANCTRRHNPAGTKLARKARDGKLTLNMRGW